jgi:hypothetical protein
VHFWVFVSRAVISSYSLGSNILVSSVAAGQGLRHILVRCSIDCLAKFVYHTVGQLLRGRTLEYGQGTLFIMRKGALRHSACYGLGVWVIMSADTQ